MKRRGMRLRRTNGVKRTSQSYMARREIHVGKSERVSRRDDPGAPPPKP